jgi:hypothetical protein
MHENINLIKVVVILPSDSLWQVSSIPSLACNKQEPTMLRLTTSEPPLSSPPSQQTSEQSSLHHLPFTLFLFNLIEY